MYRVYFSNHHYFSQHEFSTEQESVTYAKSTTFECTIYCADRAVGFYGYFTGYRRF